MGSQIIACLSTMQPLTVLLLATAACLQLAKANPTWNAAPPPKPAPKPKPVYKPEEVPAWGTSLGRANKVLIVDKQEGQDYGNDAYLDLVNGINSAKERILQFVADEQEKNSKTDDKKTAKKTEAKVYYGNDEKESSRRRRRRRM